MDRAWWQHHIKEVDAVFRGARFTVHLLPHRFGTVTLKQCGFRSYNNSGVGAISLAVYAGAARVILLGYDCQRTGGKAHWHGDHPRGLGNAGSIAQWQPSFAAIRERMDKLGVQYVNCTRETALDWPRCTLESQL